MMWLCNAICVREFVTQRQTSPVRNGRGMYCKIRPFFFSSSFPSQVYWMVTQVQGFGTFLFRWSAFLSKNTEIQLFF